MKIGIVICDRYRSCGGAVPCETLEAFFGRNDERGGGHLRDRAEPLDRHLLLLQAEVPPEGFGVLPVERAAGASLEPVERLRRGDVHADALDLLRLRRHRVEARELAQPRHHIEVQVAAWG
jgi:hypothetical protein